MERMALAHSLISPLSPSSFPTIPSSPSAFLYNSCQLHRITVYQGPPVPTLGWDSSRWPLLSFLFSIPGLTKSVNLGLTEACPQEPSTHFHLIGTQSLVQTQSSSSSFLLPLPSFPPICLHSFGTPGNPLKPSLPVTSQPPQWAGIQSVQQQLKKGTWLNKDKTRYLWKKKTLQIPQTQMPGFKCKSTNMNKQDNRLLQKLSVLLP